MKDLILPRTDAGVAVQLVVLVLAYLGAVALLRRQRDWLLLATGVAVLTLGFFGVRALH